MNELEYMISKGIECKIFSIKSIKDIKQSCGKNCKTEVIDYDKTKEEYFKIINAGRGKTGYSFEDLKSCDALKIIPDNDRIDFIEFKGFEDFKRMNTSSYKGIKLVNKVNEQIKKFDLCKKIDDSYTIFKMLLQLTKLHLNQSQREYILSIKVNYIILIDIDIENEPLHNFAATMTLLSNGLFDDKNIDNTIMECLEKNIQNIEDRRINKPIIKSTKKIDNYYNYIENNNRNIN